MTDYDGNEDARRCYEVAYDEKRLRVARAWASLSADGFSSDLWQALVYGDPSRGIPPGALDRAIYAALRRAAE